MWAMWVLVVFVTGYIVQRLRSLDMGLNIVLIPIKDLLTTIRVINKGLSRGRGSDASR